MTRTDIPVPAPANWPRTGPLAEHELDERNADRESAVATAIRQNLAHSAMTQADPFTELVFDQALVNDTTECFPRLQRRPEPSALPTPGPTVIPCSRIARWYLALRRFWRG